MPKKFIITSGTSVGCTFLDWSIHYLSGADKFYNLECGSIPLTDNPLSIGAANNAHQHQKNHPLGIDETLAAINQFSAITDHNLLSMYPSHITHDMLSGVTSKVYNSDKYAQLVKDSGGYSSGKIDNIIEVQQQDFSKIWDACYNADYELIYIKNTTYPIYDQTLNRTFQSTGKEGLPVNFLKLFFADKLADQQIDLDTTPEWDLREFIALNIDATAIHSRDNYIDFKKPHHYVDAREVWCNAFAVVNNIMSVMSITIDSSRVESWQRVYTEWQRRQAKILSLAWTIDHICECIVNGNYYDLTPHNLTLWNEAFILSVLLRKHGKNLKAWGMKSFPNNTIELHKLVEPSIHNLK